MTGPGAPTVADVILALLLCGILGVLGQGVRAIVGLKNAGSLNSTTPGEQAVFSVAYLALSLMIGFIAGVLAGIALNLETIITVDPSNWKLLIGIAGSGYIGADFIENAMSVVIPGTKPRQAKAPPLSVGPATAAPLPPRIWRKAPPPTPQTDGAKALTAAMRTVCPEVNPAVWAPVLASAFDNFDFSNDRRKAAAVGQFLVEAGPALNATVEDLYYSPDRACEVWPALFSSPQAAASYCDDPRRFADYVYAGVNGNGDAGAEMATVFGGAVSFSSPDATNTRRLAARSGRRRRRRPPSARRMKARLGRDAGTSRETAACHSPTPGTSTPSLAASTAPRWRRRASACGIQMRC